MDVTLASLSNLFSADALVIGLLALLLFGKNLPVVARNVGRTIAEFKRAAHEATSEIRREMDEAARSVEVSEMKSVFRPDGPRANAMPPTPPSPLAPDAATPGPRIQPAGNTVAYTPKPAAATPPAVSAAAALDTFRIDVKPPTKVPPPIERA